MRRSISWKHPPLSLILLVLAVCLSGCGKPAPKKDSKDSKPPEATQSAEDKGTSATNDDSSQKKDAMADYPFEDVSMELSNGIKLHGRLYDPSQMKDGAAEKKDPPKKYPLVLLLHMLNGSALDWGTLPKELVSKGYSVFAPDLPGHGASDRMTDGAMAGWRSFEPEDWQNIPRMVDRISRYFQESADDYPQVAAGNMAVIGASLGANIALAAGSSAPGKIKAIVVLSPSLNSKGLTLSDPILHYKNAIFISASQEDTEANEAAEDLYHLALGPKVIRIYKTVGHGTDMLVNRPKLGKEISQWLQSVYPATPDRPVNQAPQDKKSETEEKSDNAKEDAVNQSKSASAR